MIPVFSAKPATAVAPKPHRTRPQTTKRASSTLVLGKTKRTILLLLGRHVFLRADQLCAIAFGKSEPFIQGHLRELTQAGWLLRARYLRESDMGSTPYVYTLNTPAWDWVAELGLPTPERFRPSEEIGKASPHTMDISAFGVALERSCRGNPLVQIAQYRHERVLPYASVRLPNGTTRRLRPDAWMQLAITRPEGLKQRAWVLECDRASEYQQAFRDKIQALLAWRKDGYRQQFGTESIAILFTVPTPHRRNLVRAYLEAEIAAHEHLVGKKVRPDLFWITDADPRQLDAALFTAPVWVHPFSDARVALLDLGVPAAGGHEDAFSSGFLGEHGMLRFYQSLGERPPMTSLETDLDEVV